MTGNGQPGVLQVLSTSRLAKYNYLQTGVCDTYVWAVGEKRRGGGCSACLLCMVCPECRIFLS